MHQSFLQVSRIKSLILASIISICFAVVPMITVFAEDNDSTFSLTNDSTTTPIKRGAMSYVTVSLVASQNLNIDALQGYFSTSSAQDGQTSHITLADFQEIQKAQADFDYDINNGLAWHVNEHGSSFSADEAIFKAIYKVDDSTPAGEYDITMKFTTYTQHGDSSASRPETLTTKIVVVDNPNPTPGQPVDQSQEQSGNPSQENKIATNPNTGNNSKEANASAGSGIMWIIASAAIALIGLFGYKIFTRKKT